MRIQEAPSGHKKRKVSHHLPHNDALPLDSTRQGIQRVLCIHMNSLARMGTESIFCTHRMTFEKLRKLTRPKRKQALLFRNQRTDKALSDRIWRDGLQEMLVESGLATWAEGDSNDLRKTDITSGKNLTWYSFRHTWITFALERGVPIATVCNNCDTSIQYVQEHYFHYGAKRATDALSTGRGQLKGATGTDWMRDPYMSES